MRLRDSTKPNNQEDHLYYLLSILLVVVISLIARSFQEFRTSRIPRFIIVDYLCPIDGLEVRSEKPIIINLNSISNARGPKKFLKYLFV